MMRGGGSSCGAVAGAGEGEASGAGVDAGAGEAWGDGEACGAGGALRAPPARPPVPAVEADATSRRTATAHANAPIRNILSTHPLRMLDLLRRTP